MNVELLTTKLTRMLREDGVASTCRRMLAHLVRREHVDAFDAVNGTETGGLEPLWKFDIHSPNARYGARYEASTENELVAALESLGESLEEFSFVDLGCGKCRTLLVAARMGFREVIGVEFARELAQVAARNLAERQVRNSIVVHADAADVMLPEGDTVVYRYNPFSEEVMTKVLSNLRRSQSGKLYVAYKGPRCASLLDNCGFLERYERPSAAPHIQIWRGVRAGRGVQDKPDA